MPLTRTNRLLLGVASAALLAWLGCNLQSAFVCGRPARGVPGELAAGGFERLPAAAARGLTAQSLDQFRLERRARQEAGAPRTRIYLCSLGWPADTGGGLLPMLAAHVEAYFGRPTTLLPPRTLGLAGLGNRRNPGTGQLQILTKDVLARLRDHLPADGICLLAITPLDLYPEPAWNFVFADASPEDRVSVMSLARYHPAGSAAAMGAGTAREPAAGAAPASWLTEVPALAAEAGQATPDQVAVRRALAVTTSQVGRVLGLAPCVEYRCTMNWTNSMAELDARPLHACPGCAAKLALELGFDPRTRDRGLVDHYRALGLGDDAAWQQAWNARTWGP